MALFDFRHPAEQIPLPVFWEEVGKRPVQEGGVGFLLEVAPPRSGGS
jgi:hypothetical protein